MTNPLPQYLDEASLMLDDEISGPRLTRVAIALEGRDARYKELEFQYNIEKSRVRHLEIKLARVRGQVLDRGVTTGTSITYTPPEGAIIDEPAEGTDTGR